MKKKIEEELGTIKQMLDFKEFTEKRGTGPPTKKFIDSYPGDQVIIELLKTKYDFKYEEPRKMIRYDAHGNVIEDAANFFKTKNKDRTADSTEIESADKSK